MLNNNATNPLNFEELFDIKEMQKIQDAFSAATGVASLIVNAEGLPITKPSGFCDLCNAIRNTKQGKINCQISDKIIGAKSDHLVSQKCLSGNFYDVGASIIVEDQHICSWLIGQVVVEGVSDEELLEYADVVGIDRDEYKKMLINVKRMTLIEFENLGNFLYINAKYLSVIAKQRLDLSREVEARIKKEKEIVFLGNHDILTGLYNRRFFDDELLRLDTKRNYPISIIMADVNGLKLINDSYGHYFGDQLLIQLAQIFKKTFRTDDIIARLGGDEFAMILPNTSLGEAENIIDRVKKACSFQKTEALDFSVSYGFDAKTEEDQDMLQVVINAENHMYQLKSYESASMRHNTIELIMKALFEKNQREKYHSDRVSFISKTLAIKAGLSKDEVKRIQTAGLMHDIGKIGISETILNNPSKLSEQDFLEIQKHPEIGYRILNASSDFNIISEDVLQHHERWDGKGYPKGLKGEEISIVARIIALADTYDAMISDRAYRKAYSKEYALAEIEKCSGSQFDPKLVPLFMNLVIDNFL
ncbi:MAG: diguanylate cyclase [Erysipelotrichaceae bacterium]|nr:diguanylate cyclase [Erysipelotrichaceae bacterium]